MGLRDTLRLTVTTLQTMDEESDKLVKAEEQIQRLQQQVSAIQGRIQETKEYLGTLRSQLIDDLKE